MLQLLGRNAFLIHHLSVSVIIHARLSRSSACYGAYFCTHPIRQPTASAKALLQVELFLFFTCDTAIFGDQTLAYF